MGIRFERNYRKATNGPVFFFSILRDEVFEEEIRSAFISGLSFYAYRFPNDNMLTFGSSETYTEGIGIPGFTIGLFSPDKPFITIPYKNPVTRPDGQESEIDRNLYSMPSTSTTFQEYSYEVEEIVRALKAGEGKKVVASRVIVKDTNFDIADKFYDLCQRFPDAMVFCFSTPVTGCWIGASPELLLESHDDKIRSMALAGTRPIGTQMPWDAKNIEEQKIVADYICEVFKRHGLTPELGETFTKATGKIEHICTPILADGMENLKGNANTDVKADALEKLIRDFSPTPALCGDPKKFALAKIRELEHFDRGCYGGFCGPFHSLGDFTFHVVLRCASVAEKRYCLYAGGGITAQSNVALEWEETELKAIW